MAQRAGASNFFHFSPRLPRDMHHEHGLSNSLEARGGGKRTYAVNIESGGVIMQEEYRALTCRSELRLGFYRFRSTLLLNGTGRSNRNKDFD